jgi:outer membrane biogenesis lipoprotein LolB
VSRFRPLAVAALLALGACRAPAPVPLAPDDPRPAAWVSAWSQRAAQRQALRAEARLAVDAEATGGADPVHVRSRQFLVMARPAKLRIEVQGMLGTTLAVLAIDDDVYALFETESRRFEQGPVPADLLWRVARLPLSAQEVVEVVLGAPDLARGEPVRAAWALSDGGLRVDLAGDAGPARLLRFDAEGQLRELSARGADGAGWTARFDDYAPVAGEPLAHRVSIETLHANAVLQLRDVELNPALSADIFRLDGSLARSGAEGG